ncbi:hypothetical protein LLG95_17630 [bacterium]|nr:hypothetical protein [bacterium]
MECAEKQPDVYVFSVGKLVVTECGVNQSAEGARENSLGQSEATPQDTIPRK